MRKILKFCLLVTAFFFWHSTSSKAQIRLSGKVLDSLTLIGLQGANVKLMNSKDSLISLSSAGPNGTFAITVPSDGKYRLSANFLGYKPTSLALLIKPGERGKTLDILLPSQIMELEAVEITAPAPMVEVRGDTTEFNAAAFSTEPYADADALVTQIPGVEMDDEGNIKAQGEDVKRIIVDGKEFFSSDPRIALKTLPADVIDKIQIIDEQSEQARFTGFDDGQRRKIINIVTKPDRRHGYFGRVAGAMGSNERYNGGGFMNFFNNSRRLSVMAVSNNVNQQNFSMAEIGADGGGGGGGRRGGGGGGRGGNGQSKTNNVSLNYNNTWLNDRLEFSGDYTYNTRDNDVNSINNRQLLIGDGDDQFRVQQNLSNSINNSHRANMKMEFKPDSNQSMVFTPTFSYQQNNRLSSNTSNTVNESQNPLTNANSNNDNQNRNINIGGDFTYRFRLGKQGRTISLSANGSYSSNKGLAQALSFTQYFDEAIEGRTDTVNNQNNSLGNGNGITGRLAYTEPLDSFSRIQANYSIRNTTNFSNRETFNFLAETGQYSELDERLSNEFRNEYLYNSGGLSYQWSKEIVMFDFGVDYQRAEMQNHKIFPEDVKARERFASYLPNANLRLRFSREMNLRFEYSTSTNPPSIDQLQDVTTSNSTQSVRSGNPDLKQEFQQRFRLSFDKVNRETGANLNVSMNADFSNNRVVNSVLIAARDTMIGEFELGKGGQYTRPENLNGYYSLRANGTFGTPIPALKINLNLSTNVFKTRDVGLMNNALSASNSYGFSQKVGVNSHISEKLIFGLSFNASYSVVRNNLTPDQNTNYYNQTIRNDFTWIFWKGIRINSSILYNYNSGLTGGLNPSFVTWNASIGKKLFSREEAEITLSGYDLLNNSTNVSRDVNERYIQDSQTLNMLRQYFTLGFTYNLRNFGGRAMGSGAGFRRGGGGFGGGGGRRGGGVQNN